MTGPCQNYLQCIDLDDGFECKCQPGFKGRKCEVNIDDCLSNPCSRNGHCIDKVNGYLFIVYYIYFLYFDHVKA